MSLEANVQEVLEAVDLLASGLTSVTKSLAGIDEKISQVLAILTEEPASPSPLEEALQQMAAALEAILTRLERIERAVVT